MRDRIRGVRGKENEARKVAMYLVKHCCDRTLPEIAKYFGTNGYATVSWNCRVVEFKMAKETKFKDQIEKITASISQRST
jgi:chromosomal replication initiation ATPase DnaA